LSIQPLPEITEDTEAFWSGGAAGELRINRCGSCRKWFHPPVPICPHCLSREVRAEVASGRAVVAACTVNHQQWWPDMAVPFSIAIVELADQSDVRLTTNIVGVDPYEVSIGMNVEVIFDQVSDDVWLPRFRPVAQ
jgi:uncharacterized protein